MHVLPRVLSTITESLFTIYICSCIGKLSTKLDIGKEISALLQEVTDLVV